MQASVKSVPHATLAAWHDLHARLRGWPSSVEHSRPSRRQRAHGRSSAHAVFEARQWLHACKRLRLELVELEPVICDPPCSESPAEACGSCGFPVSVSSSSPSEALCEGLDAGAGVGEGFSGLFYHVEPAASHYAPQARGHQAPGQGIQKHLGINLHMALAMGRAGRKRTRLDGAWRPWTRSRPSASRPRRRPCRSSRSYRRGAADPLGLTSGPARRFRP